MPPRWLLGGLLLAIALAATGTALPLPEPLAVVITVHPSGWLTGFTTPVLAAPVGGPITLLNLDVMRHNFVATDAFGPSTQPWCDNFPAGQCPLFWSRLAALGEGVPVQGLDLLEPLTQYDYVCTTHPGPMRGVLVALPAAT